MTNSKEPYAFKIYEKINFRQGEEVDDLYSISIDPEVDVIQESNYIQLRGVLIVSGIIKLCQKKNPCTLLMTKRRMLYSKYERWTMDL